MFFLRGYDIHLDCQLPVYSSVFRSLKIFHNKIILWYHSQPQLLPARNLLLLLLLLLLKNVSNERLGETDLHPISTKTPAPQYQPIGIQNWLTKRERAA